MAPTIPIDFFGQKESRKCSLSQMMMGSKSRKVSKGQSIGFIPDYRHAVETMGESEGFGSSGRVETEISVSEDSSAPKRKCISLNVDGYDSFGVPYQVISLSKMSKSERKDVELRLKRELEQVRMLQKKLYLVDTTIISSDIRSCSDGGFNRSSGALASQGKKRAPPGRNGTKKGVPGNFDRPKADVVPRTSNSILMKQCETMLNRLMAHNFGWVFNTPVDAVKLNIPDYFTVIKHPMDLGTVKSRITSGKYSSPLDFATDVRLTFSNAITYNPPGNDVHIMAETLSKFFEVRWKPIAKKLPETVNTQPMESRSGVIAETAQPPPSKKKKINPPGEVVKAEPHRLVMTVEEKTKLGTELEELLGELPEGVIDFLKENAFSEGQTNEDEIEIDMDAINDETLFKLRKLLDDYLIEKQKKLAKSEPCEMELRNESGFSNSSLPQWKGNDIVDEDVDILGGNDPPMSSYPPVEIEKDAVHRNSKCSSSSSSSSDSGSSSSDSDSGSSSGSDSGAAAKARGPENLGSGAELDQKRSGDGDPSIRMESMDVVGQVERSQCKISSVETNDRQEGESSPSKRQVSPDKLYRAALLKGRFADTILKAQEKALEKVEKDPEKLRLEREELERRQREEKARLQAEAKVAEEARKKAEAESAAEAAAEARRKRELEREAARQKLQEMERTVEMNENSQFMEDLEMLRAANDEHIPIFTEEAIPDDSQNELGSFSLQGSFKLQGSNPLEQLGLYMKMDEEEEESPPASPSPPAPSDMKTINHVEDGEIDIVD